MSRESFGGVGWGTAQWGEAGDSPAAEGTLGDLVMGGNGE